MNDLRKTKVQLAAEAAQLRSRVAELETAEAARQHAENALHQSEASLRALLNAVNDSMMLIEPDGTVVAVNETTAARLNTSVAEMLGRSAYDFVSSEVAAHRRMYVAQIMATGQPTRFVDERRGRWIDNSVYPIVDDQGRVVRLAIFGRDITEQKQTEIALRQALIKYQTLFNAFPLGLTISDRTGQILETNQVSASLLGISQTEHKQRSIDAAEWRLVRPDGTPMPSNEFASVRALQENRPIENVEMGVVKSPTETTWLSVTAAPLPLADGGIVITYNDITGRKQAEAQREAALDALRQSEASLRAIFEHTQQSFMLIDRDRRVQKFNRAASERARAIYNREIQPGDSIYDLVPSTAQADFEQLFEHVLAGESLRLERSFSPGGQPRWYEYYVAPVYASPGQASGVFLIVADITERKQGDSALRESEERFRSLLQTIPTVAVQGYQLDGTTHYWNAASEQLYGYTAAEALGRNLLDLIIPPEMRDGVRQAMRQMAETGQPIPAAELALLRKDGSRVAVFSSHAIVQPLDRAPELFCLDVDLTERKRTEAALRTNRDYLLAVLDATNDAIFVDDADTGQIIDVNQRMCEMYGYTREEALRTPIGDLSLGEPPYAQAEALAWLTKARQVGPQTFEWRAKRKDGQLFWAEVSIRFAMFGHDARFVVTVRDITERKRTEEALRDSEERFRLAFDTSPDAVNINRLTDGLYVDINQGFTALTGFTREDAIGKTSAEINIWHNPADRQKLVQSLITTGYCENLEAQFRRKDGGLTTALMSARVLALQGVPHILSITRDISERKRVEEALQTSERQLHLIADNLPAVVNYVDAQTLRYRFVNRGYADLFGRSPEQIIGKQVSEIMDATAYRQALPYIERARAGEHVHYENLLLSREGPRWFSISYEPDLDERGAVQNIIVLAVDITERKLAAEQVQRYEFIANAATEFMTLINQQHRLEAVNDAYCHAQGRSRADLIGRSLAEIWGETRYHDKILPHLARCFMGQIVQYEDTFAFTSGEQRYYQVGMYPYAAAPDGAIRYAAIVTFDITERKQAEQAEHEARQLAEALRDTATALNSSLELDDVLDQVLLNVERVVPHDGANIMLVDGDVARVARARGQCTAETIGVEQHTIALTTNLRNMRATGEPCIIDRTRDNPDWHTLSGYEWIASYAGVPIYAAGDQLLGYLGLYSTQPGYFSSEHTQRLKIFAAQTALAIQNAQLHTRMQLYTEELEERVSQRTRQLSEANAQLSELDRLKDDFISRISHELRTPLTSIKIYLELLDAGKPEKRAKYMQTLAEQTARLQQLIESLLEVTQHSVNTAGLHVVPIDLNHLAAALVADSESRAAQHGLRLTHDLPPDLPQVSADAILLTQALSHLMTNALNYTPRGGKIDLTTAQVTDQGETWITLTIRDTGPGITSADLPHIFDRFYRGRAAADYKTPGAGVGLSISRDILIALNGCLTVDSQPGIGTAFTAWLRLAA